MVKFAANLSETKEQNGESSDFIPVDDSNERLDGTKNDKATDIEGHKKKRKNRDRDKRGKIDGYKPRKKRRLSLSKAARDPRDEASPPVEPDQDTRSPSPVIDFDGLSRPSKSQQPHNLSKQDGLLLTIRRSWNPRAPRRNPRPSSRAPLQDFRRRPHNPRMSWRRPLSRRPPRDTRALRQGNVILHKRISGECSRHRQ